MAEHQRNADGGRMTNRVKLMAMLTMQDAMNAKVNPNWLQAGYPWLRAIVIEGGEAMEHYGWKWWKKQEPDVGQFGIELVDIWHFAMSSVIEGCDGNHESAAAIILESLESEYASRGIMFDSNFHEFAKMDTLARLELMIGLAATRRFSFPLFATLIADVGMSWDELHAGYVAKNVLNFFRQDNGYKTGGYIKMWAPGVEDNVALFSMVGEMDSNAPSYADDLYLRLSERYAEVLTEHGRLAESEVMKMGVKTRLA